MSWSSYQAGRLLQCRPRPFRSKGNSDHCAATNSRPDNTSRDRRKPMTKLTIRIIDRYNINYIDENGEGKRMVEKE